MMGERMWYERKGYQAGGSQDEGCLRVEAACPQRRLLLFEPTRQPGTNSDFFARGSWAKLDTA